jgi:hypothetical protein
VRRGQHNTTTSALLFAGFAHLDRRRHQQLCILRSTSLDSVVRKNAASQVELRLSRVRPVLHRSLVDSYPTDSLTIISTDPGSLGVKLAGRQHHHARTTLESTRVRGRIDELEGTNWWIN